MAVLGGGVVVVLELGRLEVGVGPEVVIMPVVLVEPSPVSPEPVPDATSHASPTPFTSLSAWS